MRESIMKTVKLEDICDVISRGISPKYTDPENGVIVLNQRCIRDKQILFEFARKHDVSAKKVQEIKYVMDGDILVNSTGHGTLGRTALAMDIKEPILVDSHITIIRPKNGFFIPKYFAYLIGTCESDFVTMATGTSGQTELPRSLLNEYEISYARSLEVQRDIVTRLDAAFERIDRATYLTQKKINHLKNLKQTMLDKAFSESTIE